MHKAPGKAFRKGVSLMELMDVFPDEKSAQDWFEGIYWPKQRHCGRCGGTGTNATPSGKPMPYWCRDCRKYFSVKTGTVMQKSNIPLRKWAIGIYLCLTSLKSVSSMKLHRDLGISQKAAWFMLHRLREAWAEQGEGFDLGGPVEVDESHFGGSRKNKSKAKRQELAGRGPIDMTPVVGMKDRESNQITARVVANTDAETLQGFVRDNAALGATLYTDDAAAYRGMSGFDHATVNHSVKEYVRQQVHTNGIESFWAMLKRAHKGTFHKISPKHLQRYVDEFAGKHNLRWADTLAQMAAVALKLSGRHLNYQNLIADNGLPSGART